MLSDEGREKIQSWGRRKRSFSIFQSSEHDTAQIADILGEVIPDLTTVHPADLLDLPDSSAPLLLYNITSEDAYENAGALHRLVIRLILWKNEPVFLLSPASSEEWERGNVWRGDGEIDKKGLRLDSLSLILNQDRLILPTPAILNLVSDQPEMTYIEEQMAKALGEKGLCFRAQALIGRYHVDFLVEKNGAQVVVECDGIVYHSSDEAKRKDKKRDSYLQGRGYPVLRFTGGKINNRVGCCVERIEQVLDESRMDQSQVLPMDDNLDGSQKKAVSTNPGQVCVLAPAGSGKTLVLTNRGIHLVNEGFDERRVLAMAFNKKAREEMQERLRKMGFSEVKRQVHTFNSYGAQLLTDRYSLKGKGFAAYEDRQYFKILFSVLENHCGELRRIKGSTQSLKDAIQKIKGELVPPGQSLEPVCRKFIREGCPKKTDPVWSAVFEEFLQWQKDSEHLTFADQVYLAVRELAEDPELRRRTQMSLDALLVDEFQDLDPAQSALVEILTTGHGNLFVVGDDDQMIYGWRGADIRRLRGFSNDRRTQTVTLSTNYRSSQLVVRHAGFLIEHNKEREKKEVAARVAAPRGAVEIFIGEDLAQEKDFLVKSLKETRGEEVHWSEFAVLVRYKELYRAVMDALRAAGIPFFCEEKAALYSRYPARALMGYFTAILDWPSPPKEIWGDILTVPNRYLSNEYVNQVGLAADPIAVLRSGKDLKDGQRKKVNRLLESLENLNKALADHPSNAHELFQRIDAVFRLAAHFKQERGFSEDNDVADEGLVLDQLKEAAKQFSDSREFLEHCEIEREQEKTGRKETGEEDHDAVQVMTIHKAKGKEWRGVVLFHLEWRQGSYESEEEQKRIEEEERRVVYVGATRAIEMLWVTAGRKSKSCFVDELFRDPGFRERDLRQEIEYRQERLGSLKREIDQLKTEENQELIKVDRSQGIDRDQLRSEFDAVRKGAGLLRRLLWCLGLKSTYLRHLEKDCCILEEADQAKQRIDQIQSQINGKGDRIEEISEEMDRLKREERFRRILATPIDTNGSSKEILS